tara:strand:+ start:1328 stop:1666 length:339 start_codon:yes stop_codon:yes gene_type:complete
MIVDDDQEDCNIMKTILEKGGHDIVIANDGASALDQLVEGGFELVIIDIQMPTLSGYDLLRLMREKVNHDVKMFYVTIVPEKEVRMDDVDGFIQKPFTPEGFMEQINKVLGK